MLGIETAFYRVLLSLSRSHELSLYYAAAVLPTHFTRSDACQWCSGSVNHSPSSSVISVYAVRNLKELTVSLYWLALFIRALFAFCVFLNTDTTHPCTSLPLHSLGHNIYFHHLPISLLSSVFLHITCRTSDSSAGLEHGLVLVMLMLGA